MGFLDKLKSKNPKRLFVTVADAGGLLMSLIYVSYISILLIFDIGYLALNYCMLGLTVAYIIFFFVKIFYLNSINPKSKFNKNIKFIHKYTKYSMKLVNATFVVISLVSIQISDSHLFSIIGVCVLMITFVFSILWDVSVCFIKKKTKELKDAWVALPIEQKKDKIDWLIDKFISGLDNMSWLDDYVELGVEAGKRVGSRFATNRQGHPEDEQHTGLLEYEHGEAENENTKTE
ncbi:MAG: hypothetical protein FWE53_05030 [Firmicutes bacterium]|nr:hypothetical protein [Bacillota bacterium]